MTALDRIIEGGGKVDHEHRPFFEVSDALAKPPSRIRESIQIDPYVANRLRKVLMFDERFNGRYGNGMGYSEFITRALDMLDCADG